MKKFVLTSAVLLLATCSSVVPVRAGLVINAIYDGSITGDPNAAAIENTINTAIQTYQSLFSNNITVSIYFQEGGGLGQSEYEVYSLAYSSFYAGLVANNANPAAISALQSNGGNSNTNGGVNPTSGSTLIETKSANARAVGINIAPGCLVGGGHCVDSGNGPLVDGIISLQTAITTPPQGLGAYSLLSVAEHEMDEILGLGSALENTQGPTDPNVSTDTAFQTGSPEDLFRWNAAVGGVRTLGTSCTIPTTALFAYGPSTGLIAPFNNACNGADFGDWASGGSPQVQDAFGTQGSTEVLGSSEIAALTAIGYTLAPEPGTWALFLGSLVAVGLARRRLSA